MADGPILTVRLSGLVPLLADLARTGRGVENQRPLLEEARAAFEEEIASRFRAEGPGWRKRAAITERKRQGEHRSGGILHETGALEASYMHGNDGHFEEWGVDFVETGSQLRYAEPHEKGFPNRGTIPVTPQNPKIRMRGQWVGPRPLLDSFDDAERRIADRYEAALVKALGL